MNHTLFNTIRRFVRFASVSALALFSLSFTGQLQAESLLIKNVRIITGDSPTASAPQDVMINEGKIQAIGGGLTLAERQIDGSGKYLMPGLIDNHVHLDGVPGYKGENSADATMLNEALHQIPRSYAYFGFTTVLDLTGSADFIAKWNQQPAGPTAHFCAPLTIPNGYPAVYFGKEAQFKMAGSEYMLYNPAQADDYPPDFNVAAHSPQAVVKLAKQNGAQCIKVFYETGFGAQRNLPVPSLELIKAIVAQAKQLGMPVLLHGNSLAAYEFAVEAGVNTLVHGLWNMGKDTVPQQQTELFSQLATQIVGAGIAVQPSIQVLYGEQELLNPEFFNDQQVQAAIPHQLVQWYQSESGQWMNHELAAHFGGANQDQKALYQKIKQAYQQPLTTVRTMTNELYQQGASLQFGSDTPSGPFYSQFPGINGRWEMDRWLESGISLSSLFSAMTIGNAKALGLDQQIGQVAVGMQADLLLLHGNPLLDVKAYDTIELVIIKGVALQRASLSARYLD
jgi:imidazolonepropionase-like amidohydrolase